jgi:hypothetical protein
MSRSIRVSFNPAQFPAWNFSCSIRHDRRHNHDALVGRHNRRQFHGAPIFLLGQEHTTAVELLHILVGTQRFHDWTGRFGQKIYILALIHIVGFPVYSYYVLRKQKWALGPFLCDLWLSIDYSVCLASIFTVLCRGNMWFASYTLFPVHMPPLQVFITLLNCSKVKSVYLCALTPFNLKTSKKIVFIIEKSIVKPHFLTFFSKICTESVCLRCI